MVTALFFIAGASLYSLDINYLNQYTIGTRILSLPTNYVSSGSHVEYMLTEPLVLDVGQQFQFNIQNASPVLLQLGKLEFLIPGSPMEKSVAVEASEATTLNRFAFISDMTDIQVHNVEIRTENESSAHKQWSFLNDSLSIAVNEDDFPLFMHFTSSDTFQEENISVEIGENLQYGIRSRKGSNAYWFYPHDHEEAPAYFTVDFKDIELIEVISPYVVDENEALPIDLEEMLYRDRSQWRGEDYEIFRWNDFPSMLIMDTANYHIQSEFFKRLAFYTEKKISSGQFLSDADLIPLHGWNAHDYKASDLARFFNEAEELEFPLNEREMELKNLLLNNGVLKQSSGRVRPGKGGILSISRESSERLRQLFLTHECYHGIFFASEEFVTSVTEIWRGLSDDERNFWRIFLDMYGYNISDEYLLINEFQAYLMQQKTELADSYFRGKINWILSLKPYLSSDMNKLLRDYGDTFSRSAQLVEKSAYSLTGIKAGDLVLKWKK